MISREEGHSAGGRQVPYAIQIMPSALNELTAAFARSADFWRMIHQRRQEQGIPWEEAKKLLDLD